MPSPGTAYVTLALKPGAAETVAADMATELRRLADYLDAYSPQPIKEDDDA